MPDNTTIPSNYITDAVTAIEIISKDTSDKLFDAATKYGPQVLDTAESYLRTIAIIEVLKATVIVSFLLIIIAIAIKHIIKWTREDMEENFLKIMWSCLIIIFIAFPAYDLCNHNFTTDNILSIISPKLELIKMSKDAIVNHVVNK